MGRQQLGRVVVRALGVALLAAGAWLPASAQEGTRFPTLITIGAHAPGDEFGTYDPLPGACYSLVPEAGASWALTVCDNDENDGDPTNGTLLATVPAGSTRVVVAEARPPPGGYRVVDPAEGRTTVSAGAGVTISFVYERVESIGSTAPTAAAQVDAQPTAGVQAVASIKGIAWLPGACFSFSAEGGVPWERTACDNDAVDEERLAGIVRVSVPTAGSPVSVAVIVTAPPSGEPVRLTDESTETVVVTAEPDQTTSAWFFYEVVEATSASDPNADISAPPPADPNADRECRSFVAGLADSPLAGFDAEAVATFTGCRLGADGSWFYPTGPDDPRLPNGPPLDTAERERTAALRQRIEEQVWALVAKLEMTPDMGNMTAGRSLMDGLAELRPHLSPPYRGLGPDMAMSRRTYRDMYQPVIGDFLLHPNNEALRAYVVWWVSRRLPAATERCRLMDPLSCQLMWGALGADRAPWPWELSDPLTLDEYLDWALANGRAPAA